MPADIADDFLERLKAATCLVESNGKSGTGFLVSGNRIVTCLHVVAEAKTGQPVHVKFSGQRSLAYRTDRGSAAADIAVLEVRQPLPGIAPLAFGRVPRRKSSWETYGFPGLASGNGLPLEGSIEDPNYRDRGGAELLLSAGKLLGNAASPHGYSGSPVVVNGLVVGQLKQILPDPDYVNRPAFGTLYASRSDDFLAVLEDERIVEETPPAPAPGPLLEHGYEVFLSAAPSDFPKARSLVTALQQRGRRVFFGAEDLVPGLPDNEALADAVSRSRAGIALITRAWLEAAGAEREMLWDRRQQTTTSFPLVTVLLDDLAGSLPDPWNDLRPVDFRGKKSFTGPRFERLLYALDGRIAPYEVIAADIAEGSEPTADVARSVADARRLISIGNPRRALALLPERSSEVTVRRTRALALAKTGESEQALIILRDLQRAGQLDAETGGILAGRYRQQADDLRQPYLLELALETYREVFDRTRDPYPGINTASLLLQLGKSDEAEQVAARVMEILDAGLDADTDHWTFATRAEALLIRGQVDESRRMYGRAASYDVGLLQDIAVMRKGARRVLKARRMDPHEFDTVFAIPRPVAFVGHGFDLPGQRRRFPIEYEAAVRILIREALDRHNVRLGLASVTVGGDTIFLQELLRRGGSARVILPCPEGQFLDLFVPRLRQYDVRKVFTNSRVDVITIGSSQDPADLWNDFGGCLRDKAIEWRTQLDNEKPFLLALWDRQPSYLGSIIDVWRGEGFDEEILDIADLGAAEARV